VAALRRLMRKEGLHAYLVPTADPHLSEYVPVCWRRREWLSGFTGSAGDVVVTLREAGLWTDSRYYLQAERELDGKVFALFKTVEPETPTIEKHLIAKLRPGSVLGVDPRTVSKRRAEHIEQQLGAFDIRVKFLSRNLVDALWTDQPRVSSAPVVRHADRFAGETAESKIARMQEELDKAGAQAHVLVGLDAIAWLFNIRGTDIEFNPLAISYAILGKRDATLFVDPAKVPARIGSWLRGFARLRPYEEIGRALQDLGKKRARVLVDPVWSTRWVIDRLKGARLILENSPVVTAKTVKNAKQGGGMRAAHVRDGVALVRFLHWLEEHPRRGGLTEMDAAHRLVEFRAEGQYYKGQSFKPIVGWRGNGAVVHYDPSTSPPVRLRGRGILLLDTGGQYLDGTTDVTRTIVVGGEASARERELFTRVLQGHIRLSRAVFPPGTTGARLELHARLPLWDARLNYDHGTGHGVGQYLCVHEGPIGFSPRNPAVLEAGNILSVEPGCYETGKYGFRTENLVVLVPEKKGKAPWLKMEPLTMCPIDVRLVEASMLSADERGWLGAYHVQVRDALSPHLEAPVRAWLELATRPV
jgi:Xaa-Pro aminopeptidase